MQAHDWNLSPEAARALQEELRHRITVEEYNGPLRTIAGADISFNKGEERVSAGIIVLRYPELTPVAHALVEAEISFPYIPGLLSFREIPALLEAWNLLPQKPDILVVDGHGIAHPRGMGIAAHFGLVAGVPSIGSAKKKLVGTYTEPEPVKGASTPLTYKGKEIGWVLCTKDRVKPVFVSPGNRVGMAQSRDIILSCARGYRLPEPTRQAHNLVNRMRRGEVGKGVFEYANGLF